MLNFRYSLNSPGSDTSLVSVTNASLAANLVCPLQAGCAYEVRFYVKPWVALYLCYPYGFSDVAFIDRIGCYLSNGRITPSFYIDQSTSPISNFTPQILSPAGVIIDDTSSWTLVSGTYIATGGEDHITIGSFDTSLRTMAQYNPPRHLVPGALYSSLYQIDDVSVTPLTNLPPIDIGNDTTICRGDAFSKVLDAGAGHGPYLWSTGETTQAIVVTQPGVYWVKGSGACTCSEDTITIYEVDPLTSTLGNDTALCPSAFPYTIHPVTPLPNYLWNTGAATSSLTVSTPGTYWLETQTACGVVRDSITISYEPFPVVLELGNDTSICAGTSVTLRGDDRFNSYLWNTGAATDSIVVQTSGWYILSASDACGTQTDSVYVTVIPPSPVPVVRDTVVCQYDLSPLFSVQGSNLIWYESLTDQQGSTSPPVVSTQTPGTYTVYVTQDVNGCESQRAAINIVVLPVDTIIRKDTVESCAANGFQLRLMPQGSGRAYMWNTGEAAEHIVVGDTGVYWRRARIGCNEVYDSIYVQYREPLLLVVSDDTTICEGTSVRVGGNAGFDTYAWSTGAVSESIVVTTSGYYTLTVTDFCGSQTDSVLVTVLPRSPIPEVRDTTICVGVSDPRLTVSGVNLLWYRSADDVSGIDAQPEIDSRHPAEQRLYVSQNVNGCESAKASVLVAIIGPPDITLPADTFVCLGTSGQIGVEDPEGTYRYLWQTGATTPVIMVDQEGLYTVAIENECGTDTASIEVIIQACTDCLYAPDAFTPNGDGLNDVFRVGVRCPAYEYQLRIYNRWGEQVFETGRVSDGWDGTFRGRSADVGLYYYVVRYRLSELTEEVILKGDVSLIR